MKVLIFKNTESYISNKPLGKGIYTTSIINEDLLFNSEKLKSCVIEIGLLELKSYITEFAYDWIINKIDVFNNSNQLVGYLLFVPYSNNTKYKVAFQFLQD
jgi:hypothetical protein